jgi:nicotinamide phosphoribosyltransferase
MSQRLNPLLAIDFYKADHRRQYPKGTTKVYSNFTPRSAKLSPVTDEFDNRVVFFGLQGFIKSFLIETWNTEFFSKPKEMVVAQYKRMMDNTLGKGAIPIDHIEALHDLGYLPLLIKALPEGSRVNIKVPMFTITNTKDEFFWLPNYLETCLSAGVWKSCATATIAFEYKRLLAGAAMRTGAPLDGIMFQAHDFSCRGMSGVYDGPQAGAGHLTSFFGTDTVSAIAYLEDYYHADSDIELVGTSVPATEHSVMCMGTKDAEVETFRRLIMDLYPKGIVSIVSDTWDFWQVITEYTVALKEEILNRQPNEVGLAKVVFRPDSGDPVKIICGDTKAEYGSPAYKGAVECLWEVFGGTTTDKGFKVLHERVGLIYGDSITLERADMILYLLEKKGFASNNIVFGVGSYTYQYMTRDSFGFAMKATWGVVDGEPREIFKDPVTDNGIKKSAKGLLRVERTKDGFEVLDQQTELEETQGVMVPVFHDGELFNQLSLAEIRNELTNSLNALDWKKLA